MDSYRDKPRRVSPRSAALLALALGALPALAAAQQAASAEIGAADQVDSTRATLEKWVETRQLLDKQRREWALGRELLRTRIDAVERETQQYRERIAEAQSSIEEAEKSTAELEARKAELEAGTAELTATIAALEARTLALLPRLPEPIRALVKPISQQIPAPGTETGMSLGQRFEKIAGVLDQVNKFHGEITLANEVLKLPDGRTVEVTVMYLGVSQGYYVTAEGDAAGVGSSSASGWVWTPHDPAAPAIARAIAILRNQQPAAFVQLPARIQ